MPGKKVISVGQCGADHASLGRLLRERFRVEVVAADTAAAALAELGRGEVALVLVNRVFDYDGGSGLDFIRRLQADPSFAPVPVMLVSNHERAQREAVEAGALPGFGKAALGHPESAARLRAALGESGEVPEPGA